MASQWYWEFGDERMGPVSFQELADLLRAGTISDSERVCREGQDTWIEASAVPGLMRASRADQQAPNNNCNSMAGISIGAAVSAVESAVPEAVASVSKCSIEATSIQDSPRNSKYRIISMVGIAVVIVFTVGWWSSQAVRFPERRLKNAASEPLSPAVELIIPTPKTPSMPGLPARQAIELPGFEKQDQLHSPCLSADLLTIVFAHLTDGRTWFDLYLATRSKVTDDFGAPQLISTCQSPELDAYVALAPNGLELIFVRSDDRPELMYASRPDLNSSFSPAQPWGNAEINKLGQKPGYPQFFEANAVQFAIIDGNPPMRSLWQSRRSKLGLAFETPIPVACGNPWAPWRIGASGKRAFYGNENGLFMAARASPELPIGHTVVLAEATQCGPVDGPIWVAPQEDLIVYCSPGVGKKIGDGRYFWMWRLIGD